VISGEAINPVTLNLSVAHSKMGHVAVDGGEVAGALVLYQKSLDLLIEQLRFEPNNATVKRNIAISHNDLAVVYTSHSDFEKAMAHLTESLRISQELSDADSKDMLASRDLPHLGHAGALRLLLFTGNSGLFPVDAGVARLATRLGLATAQPNLRRLTRDVRRALGAVLPRDSSERRRAVLYLEHHAEHTCVESSPHCGVCPLLEECAEGRRLKAEG